MIKKEDIRAAKWWSAGRNVSIYLLGFLVPMISIYPAPDVCRDEEIDEKSIATFTSDVKTFVEKGEPISAQNLKYIAQTVEDGRFKSSQHGAPLLLATRMYLSVEDRPAEKKILRKAEDKLERYMIGQRIWRHVAVPILTILAAVVLAFVGTIKAYDLVDEGESYYY